MVPAQVLYYFGMHKLFDVEKYSQEQVLDWSQQ